MESQTLNNLHILGLGGAGSKVALEMNTLGVKAEYTLIGKPGNTLANIHQIPFISPRCRLIPEISRFMIPDISVDLILPSKVLDLLHSEMHYLLFAALGGYTGTLFTIKIAWHLHITGRKFTLITSYPFRFEGKKRAEIADMAVGQLSALHGFNPFRLDDLNKEGNLLLRQAFDFADRKMIELANAELKLGIRLPAIPRQPKPTLEQRERYLRLKEMGE